MKKHTDRDFMTALRRVLGYDPLPRGCQVDATRHARGVTRDGVTGVTGGVTPCKPAKPRRRPSGARNAFTFGTTPDTRRK